MIAFLNTPVRRIAFSIAVSALIHALILSLPYLQFPHAKVQLPPLTARIEHPDKPVETSSAKPEPDSPIAIGDNGALAASAPQAAITMKKMLASTTDTLFPKHLQLTFIAYQGAGTHRVGEVHHQLDVEQDHYTLRAETKTTTLAGLIKAKHHTQTSTGKFSKTGLQPEFFKEGTIAANRVRNLETRFDWINHTLHFANGEKTVLLADAQDILSFMYQLSQIPLHGEFFPLPISNGGQLTTHQIEIGAMEDIDTPMGKLKVRHLRQMHPPREDYFEIWLALEYRMLPVKFRQANEADETVDELVISDIRVADNQ